MYPCHFSYSRFEKQRLEKKKAKTTTKKKSIRAPTALQLFKDERAQEILRGEGPNDNEKASAVFNANQSIKDKYKEISEHIAAELDVLKEWEEDMKNYDAGLVLQSQFEADEILKGHAQFLQSMQIFGTSEEDQQDCFEERYKIFIKCNGLRLPIAQCGGQQLDLFALYRHVVLRGGLAHCIRESVFSKIGRELNIRGTDDTLAFSLRIIYFKYLFAFEQDCQIVMINGPRKKSLFWERDNQASTSNAAKENILIPRPNALSSDNFGPAFMKDASMCLLCGDPEKIKWALNRLMFASYQSHDDNIAFIDRHPQLLNGLLMLCGIPRLQDKISSLIPLFNDWPEDSRITNLAMGVFDSSDSSRKFELSSLQVLSNISLTAKNQVHMIRHPQLIPGLLRKVATAGDDEAKKLAMSTLAHLAWRISLQKAHKPNFDEALSEGLAVYAFHNKDAKRRALAENSLNFISGLAGNEVNAKFLMENVSDKILTLASEYVIATDLNVREAALQCLCHLSTATDSFTKRIFYATPTLEHLDSIVREKNLPDRIHSPCAFLLPHLLELVSEEERSRKYSLHFCSLANMASNKLYTPYSLDPLCKATIWP